MTSIKKAEVGQNIRRKGEAPGRGKNILFLSFLKNPYKSLQNIEANLQILLILLMYSYRGLKVSECYQEFIPGV